MARIATTRTLSLTTLRSLLQLNKCSELRGVSKSFAALRTLNCLKTRTWLRSSSSLASVSLPPKLELISGGRKLKVAWSDEEESIYHSMWLRHNCKCPNCWNTSLNHKTIEGQVLQGHPIITSTTVSEICGRGVVNVHWRYDDESEQHNGHFHLDWLKENSYSDNKVEKVHLDTTPPIATSFETFSYEDIKKSDEGLWRWLQHVSEYGFALVTDAPIIEGHVQKLGESVGQLVENYGYPGVIYDLKAVGYETTDISYSQRALPFHGDLCHYESPPGLQILYSLRFDDCVEGGETVLVDFYSVACDMREKHPNYFEWLTRIPFNYLRCHGKGSSRVMMEFHVPPIELNERGEIIALRYHPQSEGPLLASEEDVEKFYEAFSCLWRMLNYDAMQFPRRLRPGEVLTFNNRRMVHGRRPMKTHGGARHIQCCYVNSDDFKSKVRVLASKFAPSHYRVKNMFNSDYLC